MATLTALSNLNKNTIANSGASELSILVSIDDIQLDDTFKDLFPLNQEMVDKITLSIKETGYDKSQPIHVWKEKMMLVDGHHRRMAAIQAGLKEVPVFYHHFQNAEEALEYAILLQTNRRNLSDAEIYKTMQALDILKTKGRTSDDTGTAASGKSADITAKKIGVSRTKVEKARTVQNKASEEIKAAIEAGEMTINAAYNKTMKKERPPSKNKKTWIDIKEFPPLENERAIFLSDSFIPEIKIYTGENNSDVYWLPLSVLPPVPKNDTEE